MKETSKKVSKPSQKTKQRKSPFLIYNALSFTYRILLRDWRLYLGVAIAFGVAIYSPPLIKVAYEQGGGSLGEGYSILIALFTVLQILLGMGVVKLALASYDNKKRPFSDIYAPYSLFFNYVIASILYMLIIAGGLVLVIVPGIFWAIRFGYFHYAVIDESLGPIEALKKSYYATSGQEWHLLGFSIVVGIISILFSVVVPFIGPLVAVSIQALSMGYVYRKLSR